MVKLALATLAAAFLALAACAPTQEVQGIGSGPDQYKKSPCAGCGPLIPQPNLTRHVPV